MKETNHSMQNELDLLADALDKYIGCDERKARAASSIMGKYSIKETIKILQEAGDRIIEVDWAEGYDRIREIRFVSHDVQKNR